MKTYIDLFKKYSTYIILGIIIFGPILIILSGCAETQPEKVIIKKVYIKQPKPKLETINLKDLNLSNDKPLNLHIKLIKKDKK